MKYQRAGACPRIVVDVCAVHPRRHWLVASLSGNPH